MTMTLDGTSGLTTPGVVNTAGETIATTLAVTGASTLTGAVTASTTLAVTGVSTFAAGTALLPALTTTGDTNTGLWFPAADTVAASTGGTERMRINSAGQALFGATSLLGSRNSQVGININGKDDALFIQNYGSGIGYGVTMRPSSSSGGGNGDCFNFTNTSFTTVGTIATSSSATAYNTSSDYRLKENISPMTGALATVAQLKPVTYKWKADGKDGQGFIAHELQVVVPDCVSGEKDAVDADGKIKPQGIDTSFLVATLTAAIQEQQALITQLQADVAALKALSA